MDHDKRTPLQTASSRIAGSPAVFAYRAAGRLIGGPWQVHIPAASQTSLS